MSVLTLEIDRLVLQALSLVESISAPMPAKADESSAVEKKLVLQRSDTDFMISERADFRQRVSKFRMKQKEIQAARNQFSDKKWKEVRSALAMMSGNS